uniref:hypothetical protein n=1 Tax=Agathobacter sp. TaxID=2021311 RepID=UPI004056DE3E
MTDILLIIIIALIAYIIHILKGQTGSEEKEKKKISYQKVLPEYLNKMCEITLKEPLAVLDIMFSTKGILVDLDEEWVMLEVDVKKKKVVKMFRIDNISSIKEIL